MIDGELERAHLDYLKRRNEIISKLNTIYSRLDLNTHEAKWLMQAIDFIKEKEI